MSYPTHRRRPGGIATLVLAGVAALAAGRARAEEPNHFTHGPILGRLSDSGVGVWGRLARAGSFVVRYGTSAARFDRASAEARAEPAHDNTAWVLLDGLEPDTEYFYELAHVDLPGRTGRGGSFRTLPRAQDFAHPELNPRGLFNFSFEVACGNNQNLGQSSGPALPTFRTMLPALKDRIHFAILNGDWLYEARREFTPAQWQAQTSTPDTQVPQVLRVAPTLAGVWENYKHYLSQGEPLARWHRHIASFFTYDDHEALNDIWGAGSPGLRDRRAVFRDIGVRAWYDYLGGATRTRTPSRSGSGARGWRKGATSCTIRRRTSPRSTSPR
jgi:phosphodiesterase/alkaline phosphatase D-like protein